MDDSATYTVSDVIVVPLRTLSPPPPSCRRTQETRNETSNHDSMRPIIDSCRVFPAIRSKINLTYVQARISNLKPDQISLTNVARTFLFSSPHFSLPRSSRIREMTSITPIEIGYLYFSSKLTFLKYTRDSLIYPLLQAFVSYRCSH